MNFDREEVRRRREYQKRLETKRKLEEKLADAKRRERSARSRLLASTTKSETWHRMALGWLDRDASYAGEMASARVWLRSLPVREYVSLINETARNMPAGSRNIDVEFALVKGNLESWTIMGDALLLQRARALYVEEVRSFREWQQSHPGSDAWRRKPATRAQRFLVSRTAAVLGMDVPLRMTRGDAFDWLERNGGNLRLTGTGNTEAAAPQVYANAAGADAVAGEPEALATSNKPSASNQEHGS